MSSYGWNSVLVIFVFGSLCIDDFYEINARYKMLSINNIYV